MAMLEMINAGRSSYKPKNGMLAARNCLSTSFQTNTLIPPASIPAMAPVRVVLFQKSEKSMIGPKVAPKPAHAKDTRVKITLSSFHAIITPTSAITIRMTLDNHITCFSVAFSFLIIPLKMLTETAEDAIKR